jgi:hypothetical protein
MEAIRESFERIDDNFFDELQALLTFFLSENPEVVEKYANEAKLIHLLSTAQARIQLGDLPDLTIARKQYTYKLGGSPLPNEHRWHKHGKFDRRFEARQCETTVFVKFTHPTLDRYLNDAITCSAISGLASVIAAVVGGNIAGGYIIFYPLWKACMLIKVGESVVNDFKIELSSENRCGCWENHDEQSCRL